jgi:hypothetical protein
MTSVLGDGLTSPPCRVAEGDGNLPPYMVTAPMSFKAGLRTPECLY